MNLMLGSGGYEWTVIPVEQRGRYTEALEFIRRHHTPAECDAHGAVQRQNQALDADAGRAYTGDSVEQ